MLPSSMSTVQIHPAASSTAGGWFNLCQYLETQDINPQLQSPLYNGRIPNEIRALIFKYALIESPGPAAIKIDPSLRSHDHSVLTPNTRMWQTRLPLSKAKLPQDVDIALLLTCRQVYLETHSLPLLQKEHAFYYIHGPDHLGLFYSRSRNIEDYFRHVLSKPAPTPGFLRKDLVRSVRLLTQQYWLEDKLFLLASTTDYLNTVECLRITLRRCDWWNWGRSHFLMINPFRGNVYPPLRLETMRTDMQADDGNIPFQPKAWGLVFEKIPKLRTLIIDFEASEDLKPQMETIVDWAVKWRFPLAGDRYLTAEGQPVEKMGWRGLAHDWSSVLGACCKGLQHCRGDCDDCLERGRLEVNGPMLYIWTVTWKPSSRNAGHDMQDNF
ncbi:hypothetical protein F5X99DRAFT_376522 [Biscogniauxia marginata]|nr:hypothetical protein F5X99DRAFT_376522 [Biscogniauxia marginata]